MAVCENCGQPVTETYCGHCGQKRMPERLSFGFLWHELFHFFTHIEKGFFHTTWQMVRSPGRMVMAYIGGRRKQYQSPVSYFLIWTTILILTLYAISSLFGPNTAIDYKEYFGPGKSTAYTLRHLGFMLMIIIPFQSLHFYLLIARPRYNYIESVVMLTYVIGTIIFLQFIFALGSVVFYALTGRAVDLLYSDACKAGIAIWFTVDFLRHYTLRHKVIRGIAVVLLIAVTFNVYRLLVVPQITSFILH